MIDILTSHGWKRLNTLESGELVASCSPDRHIEYHPIQAIQSFMYQGPLISVHQRNGLIFQITPDHRMVINTQREDGQWRFKRADELKTDTIPRSGIWSGTLVKTHYTLPMPSGQGLGHNINATSSLPMDDWLEFFGWWMAEGCSFQQSNGSHSPVISIRQTRLDFLPDLTALFDRLPWRYTYTLDGQYKIFSRQLYNELHPLGSAYTKRVPRWIFDLQPQQLLIFWNAFVKGDGYIGRSREITIGLCNEGLVNDLQEIALRLGLVATKGYQYTKTGFDVHTLYVSANRSGTQIKRNELAQVAYHGEVWSLNVAPYHTILARLNGRHFWIGDDEVKANESLKIPREKGIVKQSEEWRRKKSESIKETLRKKREMRSLSESPQNA